MECINASEGKRYSERHRSLLFMTRVPRNNLCRERFILNLRLAETVDERAVSPDDPC